MKPILELVLKGGDADKIAAVACGKCNRVALNRQMAERCCVPLRCDMCPAECERGWTRCKSCQGKVYADERQAVYEKATKVPIAEYDFGYVCIDGCEESSDIDDVVNNNDDVGSDDDDFVPWAFACMPIAWPTLDAHNIIETMCNDLWKDAHEDLDADALQQALDAWREAQGPCTGHLWDRSRVVVFDARPKDIS